MVLWVEDGISSECLSYVSGNKMFNQEKKEFDRKIDLFIDTSKVNIQLIDTL